MVYPVSQHTQSLSQPAWRSRAVRSPAWEVVCIIRRFKYNEWDGESVMCTAEGSLGGYGGGDEESRISNFVHPVRFGQDGSRGVRTMIPTQLR